MYDNVYENYQTGYWRKIKNGKIPYRRLSNLGKRIYESREYGLSYGKYMALKEAKLLPELKEKKEEEGNVRHFWGI